MFAQESVMDIQKEREAYLKMLVDNDAISNDQANALKLMSGDSHFYTYGNQVSVAKLNLINWGWNSWVKAKSQAVLEGFVLVPKQPTPKMIDATWNFDEEIQDMSHNSRNEFIYNAMIAAAQEPTND